jgi:hypothetical protein
MSGGDQRPVRRETGEFHAASATSETKQNHQPLKVELGAVTGATRTDHGRPLPFSHPHAAEAAPLTAFHRARKKMVFDAADQFGYAGFKSGPSTYR